MRATVVKFEDERMVVNLDDGRSISLPIEWFPSLREASVEDRNRWELIGDGEGIHWPNLDEDLSVQGLLALDAGPIRARERKKPLDRDLAAMAHAAGMIVHMQDHTGAVCKCQIDWYFSYKYKLTNDSELVSCKNCLSRMAAANTRAKIRCFACGWFTNEVTDGGPSPEEVYQSHRWQTGVLDVHEGDEGGHGSGRGCLAAVACWSCFWEVNPDMWTLAKHWDNLGPIVPSPSLPKMLDTDIINFSHENPLSYPWPAHVPIRRKAFDPSDPSDR